MCGIAGTVSTDGPIEPGLTDRMCAVMRHRGPDSQLVLARDRVGKKPLFYAHSGGRLWFASQLTAILAGGEVPRDVDPTAIDLYLHYQCVPSPRTAFAAIRKLPPAHTLTWRDGAVSL